jgi:quinone-modifying oxidoreductase, subunit QmoC
MNHPLDIVLESSTKRDFIDELKGVPGGERIRDCIQCGVCSGSCPVSYAMDLPPRQIIASIRAGMRDRVLGCESLWLCTSCYHCTLRCPRQIAVTDIIYALKRLAMAEGKVEGAARAVAMAKSFADQIEKRGRNHETSLLMAYYMKTNPFAAIGMAPLGMKLMSRGRMPLTGEKIRGIDQIRAIVAKTREIGGL